MRLLMREYCLDPEECAFMGDGADESRFMGGPITDSGPPCLLRDWIQRYDARMCRSIHRLRDGRAIDERADIEEAARQYVRKVTGFGAPAAHNREVFDNAVREITDATERLMHGLEVR